MFYACVQIFDRMDEKILGGKQCLSFLGILKTKPLVIGEIGRTNASVGTRCVPLLPQLGSQGLI